MCKADLMQAIASRSGGSQRWSRRRPCTVIAEHPADSARRHNSTDWATSELRRICKPTRFPKANAGEDFDRHGEVAIGDAGSRHVHHVGDAFRRLQQLTAIPFRHRPTLRTAAIEIHAGREAGMKEVGR
jgi:hypothetical protein